MADKGKHNAGKGQSNPSSSSWLSPKGPQTGDGKTTRFIYDGIKLIFKGGKKK